jgi:hypothetical protein
MECCGTPFSVWEEVRWPLLFHAADDILGGGWRDQLTELEGPVEQGAERVLRDRNGLVVGVGESAAAQGGSDRLVGLLTVETHGGPAARGPRPGAVRAGRDTGVGRDGAGFEDLGAAAGPPVLAVGGREPEVVRRWRGRAVRGGAHGHPGDPGIGLGAVAHGPQEPGHPARRTARNGD